jgi:hypothetical protein
MVYLTVKKITKKPTEYGVPTATDTFLARFYRYGYPLINRIEIYRVH